MPDLYADGVEINIESGHWRLFNMQGTNSLTPFFTALRGEGMVRYTPAFGEKRGLPGDVLAVDYIKAIVVGYHEQRNRWLLGLQVAIYENEQPRFVELVGWPDKPDPQYSVDSHTAGRVLAEYLSCPLKLFGVKKAAQSGQFNARATVTGPAVAHQRTDVDPVQVKSKARSISLPLTHGEIWLGTVNKNQLTLRLPKEVTKEEKTRGEAPAYNQCVIDPNSHTVRLVPPTSLLGSFFGPQGRSIKFEGIRNVEHRHSIVNESRLERGDDGLAVDVTTTTHEYAVFLTLSDENLLLLRLTHVTSSDLRRRRIKVMPGGGDPSKVEADMLHMRQLQRDQVLHDRVAQFTESAAYVIAATLDKAVARTSVGEDLTQ